VVTERKTVSEILTPAAEFLQKHGIERPKREAEEVLSQVLGWRRLDLFLRFDDLLTEEQLKRCRTAIQKRATRMPLAYIVGSIEFLGLTLDVTPDVLVPRQETEILVDRILKETLEGSVLDLCCGSGAIGLALKKHAPHLDVTLADLCPRALAVARDNAAKLGLEVTCVQSDLLENIDKKFDYLVCNPPYVTEGDYPALEAEVKYEPRQALISGITGYECYQKLAPALESLGIRRAWFEIGTGMGERLIHLFSRYGWVAQVTLDFAGHERYLDLRR